LPTVDDAAVQRAVEEVAAAVAHQETEPQMNHAHAHDFGHGEAVIKLTFIATYDEKITHVSLSLFPCRASQCDVRFMEQVAAKVVTSISQWHLLESL
jgi:hypothetical protein